MLLIVEFFILNNSYVNLLMSASALSMLTIWNCVKMYQRVIYIYIYIILYYIILDYIILCYVILYPPTPAICRGSAPEKKWLCGVMKGQA